MILDLSLLLVGLGALFVGGDLLVKGGVSAARRLRVSPLVIGLTVVGFGTSMPELTVSVDAALRGSAGIAIGNVVGSNIANILLILGLAAVIRPIQAPFAPMARDLAVMLLASLVLAGLLWPGQIDRLAGAALVAALAAYLVAALRAPGTEGAAAAPAGPDVAAAPDTIAAPLIRIAIGLGALVLGARLMVDGAVSIARTFAVPEATIGLTIVAVGTSLPELATSLVAALRRQSDIAIGNVVGSNIFNVLGILGVTAIIAPLPADPRFLAFDVPVMIAVSLALAGWLWLRGGVGRGPGMAMLVAYLAYLAMLSP